jgi:tetratricopeptide (TPR) repeat protein
VAYTDLGRFAEAIADFDEAIRRKPDYGEAYVNRARALNAIGQNEKAVADYEAAVAIGADDPATCNALAWALAANPEPRLRNGAKAVSLARKACELTKWADPIFLDTLAAAYAETSNFAEAIHWQEKALALFPSSDPHAAGMRERLTLYQNRTAYRDKR